VGFGGGVRGAGGAEGRGGFISGVVGGGGKLRTVLVLLEGLTTGCPKGKKS